MSRDPASAACLVLREDPDLAEGLPEERREQAAEELRAPEIRLSAGAWRPEAPGVSDGLGLLVLQGLMIRRVGLEGRYGAELLGEGDILRPWQGGGEAPGTLELRTGWSVIVPARMAVLDREFVSRMGPYPELAVRLVARAIGRSRNLAVNMAIVHQARVDVRLHMLFWHLASRWGRVRSDGTFLPLRLTHAVLADLVAAQRPTVTSALAELGRRERVRFVDEGWLLQGDPPGELRALTEVFR